MAEGGKCYTLTDTLLRQLSRRITDGTKLGDLGTFVLKLPKHETEGAEYNKPTVQEAALHILDKWRQAQNNRQEAFEKLHTALQNSDGFRTLAADLVDWAEKEQIPGVPDPTIDELQRELKQALIDRFEDFLKNDWLDDEDAKTMPLQNHYTEPDWTKTVKKGLADEQVSLPGGLNEVLEGSPRRVKVLVIGRAGTGKSSALAKLALDWAQDSSTPKPETGLHEFSFMFVVALSGVDSNDSLVDVILEQHHLNVKHKKQTKNILETSDILIAFDGYDEYKKGTNSDIDAVISGKAQMSYIVTSRPGDYLEKREKQKMTEIRIHGLNYKNIEKCVKQYLDTDDDPYKSMRLIAEARKAGIYGLLTTPIVLLLVCVLFEEKEESLPQTKTEIVQEIVNMLIERSIAKGKLAPKEPEEMKEILKVLGQLSWEASRKDTRQMYLDKREVEKADADILNLGLLHGSMMPEKSSRHKQPKWLTYPHKLIQDFLAGFFACTCAKEEVQDMFQSWEDIKRQLEVVKFMCGLRDDPSDVIDHICQQFVEDTMRQMRGETYPGWIDVDPLIDIARESKEKLGNPLCNDHITLVQRLPLRRQSKLYWFGSQKLENIVDKTADKDIVKPASPTCVVYIEGLNMPCHDVFTAVLHMKQTITDLYLSLPNFTESDQPPFKRNPFKMSPNAKSLLLWNFAHKEIEEDLFQQLSSLDGLQILHLSDMPDMAAKLITGQRIKTSLTGLNLEHCNLTKQQCHLLCQQLQFSHRLKYLYLSGNHIGSAGAKLLAEAITSWGPNPPLRNLVLHFCKIDAAGCLALMESLRHCGELRELRLNGNPIGGTFRDLDTTASFPQLWMLKMMGTSLLEEDLLSISSMIANDRMPQLSFLGLGYEKLLKTLKPEASSHLLKFLCTVRNFKPLLPDHLSVLHCEVCGQMFKTESHKVLQAWKSIAWSVEEVAVVEGDAIIHENEIKYSIEREEMRRRNIIKERIAKSQGLKEGV